MVGDPGSIRHRPGFFLNRFVTRPCYVARVPGLNVHRTVRPLVRIGVGGRGAGFRGGEPNGIPSERCARSSNRLGSGSSGAIGGVLGGLLQVWEFERMEADRSWMYPSLCGRVVHLYVLLDILSFCEKNRELLEGMGMTCGAIRIACLLSWDKVFMDLDSMVAVPLVVLTNCPRVGLRFSERSREWGLYIARNLRRVRDLRLVCDDRRCGGLFLESLGPVESCKNLDVSAFRAPGSMGLGLRFPNLERLRVSLSELSTLASHELSALRGVDICQGASKRKLEFTDHFKNPRNLEFMDFGCSMSDSTLEFVASCDFIRRLGFRVPSRSELARLLKFPLGSSSAVEKLSVSIDYNDDAIASRVRDLMKYLHSAVSVVGVRLSMRCRSNRYALPSSVRSMFVSLSGLWRRTAPAHVRAFELRLRVSVSAGPTFACEPLLGCRIFQRSDGSDSSLTYSHGGACESIAMKFRREDCRNRNV